MPPAHPSTAANIGTSTGANSAANTGANSAANTVANTVANTGKLALPSLAHHLLQDKSFLSCYARTLAAIAMADKSVSLADFAALTDVARQSQQPALIGMLILHALEQGVDVDRALAELARAQAGVAPQECAAAWAMAQPLLQGQGLASRPLAKRLAAALQVAMSPQELAALPPEDDAGLIRQLGATARRLVKGKDVTDRVIEFARDIGDPEMIKSARACQSGALSRQALGQQFEQVAQRIEQEMALFASRAPVVGEAFASQAASGAGLPGHRSALLPPILQHPAQALRQQIEQRLAIVAARIRHERQTFQEDIDDLVHDAGNAIERSITERLQTDAWKDKDVWASIARTDFGKEAERRIARAVQRREETLRLFKEELKLFQSDMQVVQASILARQHHAELAQLMPPLRLGTRVVNAMDSAASLTLGAGTIAVAGTGAAAYLLGSAVVLPFVAPAVPFLAGAMAAAGLFKWFTDSDKRKIAEIQSKRNAIEAVVRQRLDEAAQSFSSQLDQLEHDYHQTALALLAPLVLDYEAAQQVAVLHQKLASRIIEHAGTTMNRLRLELR